MQGKQNNISSARALCFCLILVLLPQTLQAASPVDEDRLRAGIIIGILRYTQWPSEVKSQATLNLCGIGSSPGLAVMETHLDTVIVNGQTLKVTRQSQLTNNAQCHAYLVGNNLPKSIQDSIKAQQIFSICDTCQNPESHTVNLFPVPPFIRFSINLTSAVDVRVQFSADMMELAAEIIQ